MWHLELPSIFGSRKGLSKQAPWRRVGGGILLLLFLVTYMQDSLYKTLYNGFSCLKYLRTINYSFWLNSVEFDFFP